MTKANIVRLIIIHSTLISLAFLFNSPILAQETTTSTPEARLLSIPNVTLEVYPDTVTVDGDEGVEVIVVIRNDSDEQITNLTIECLDDGATHISCQSATLDSLSSNSVAHVHMQLTRPSGAPVDGSVTFYLLYSFGNNIQTGIQLDTIEVSHSSFAPPITLNIESSGNVITDWQEGRLLITITNTSDTTVEIIKLIDYAPRLQGAKPDVTTPQCLARELEFVCVDIPSTLEHRFTLRAGETISHWARVIRSDAIVPGSHLIGVQAKVAWQMPGDATDRISYVATTHRITLGVYGEQEFAQLIGVPLFLFVPGMVILTLPLLVLKFFFQNRSNFSAIELLILSVPISLLTISVYNWVQHRNVLSLYAYQDIQNLVLVAVLLGIVLVPVVVLIQSFFSKPDNGDGSMKTVQRFAIHRATRNLTRRRQ